MFKVSVETLEEYFRFDPAREPDLVRLDALIRSAAPRLERYFHPGTPAGQPGMRFKMIGYGPYYYYASRSGAAVLWPAIGVALQKNYISVYLAVRKDGVVISDLYAGTLGELRSGKGNFSFDRFDSLDSEALVRMFGEAEDLFLNRPDSVPGRI